MNKNPLKESFGQIPKIIDLLLIRHYEPQGWLCGLA